MFWFQKKHMENEELEFITYAVGKKFPLNRKTHEDGCVFEYLSIGPAIIIYYSNPTEGEIKMIESQEINIGLLNYESVLYVMAQIGGDLLECHFNVNLYSWKQKLKNIGATQNLSIFLVDSDTNIVKAMRLIQMPPYFAKALWASVDAQFSTMFDEEEYNHLIDTIERRFSIKELCQYIQYSMHCDSIRK